jgi:uncharacterized protein (DUF58 family)
VRKSDESAARAGSKLALTSEGLVWLGVTLMLALVGWLKSINLVLVLAYLMATLLLLNGLLVRLQVRRIKAAKQPHLPVLAGETATVRVNATNTGTRPATVSIEDRTGTETTGWLVRRIAPGATIACTGQRTFPTRGRFTSGLRVTSNYPLGLLRLDRIMAPNEDVVVLPAAGEANANGLRQWLLRHAGGDGRARKVLRRVTIDHADVRGVRPYRPGDPIRGIHWRSSARRGELMVREFDVAPSPELILVVEPWLPANPTPVESANLEAALSLAVTVARTWSHAFETRVTFAIAGHPDSVRTASATDSALREALIPLATVSGGRGFAALGPRAFERSLQRAARVVVSSRRNSPYAATLSRSTGRPFIALSPLSRPAWYQPPPEFASI